MDTAHHSSRLTSVCVSGVFITKGDVGMGTIVGSAVFNILCIIGVCGLFAGQVRLTKTWHGGALVEVRQRPVSLECTQGPVVLGQVIWGLMP